MLFQVDFRKGPQNMRRKLRIGRVIAHRDQICFFERFHLQSSCQFLGRTLGSRGFLLVRAQPSQPIMSGEVIRHHYLPQHIVVFEQLHLWNSILLPSLPLAKNQAEHFSCAVAGGICPAAAHQNSGLRAVGCARECVYNAKRKQQPESGQKNLFPWRNSTIASSLKVGDALSSALYAVS